MAQRAREDHRLLEVTNVSHTVRAEVVVIGSGLAGALAGLQCARKGRRVAVLERGPWLTEATVRRTYELETFTQSAEIPGIDVVRTDGRRSVRRFFPTTVGGLANFYAGVSLRMQPDEFRRWPIPYGVLEPYYREAERLLGVVAPSETVPSAPPRGRTLPALDPAIGAAAARLRAGATQLGLHPFVHPLAIDFGTCRRCTVCNQVPCPWGAKFSPRRFLQRVTAERPITVYPNHRVHALLRRGDSDRVMGVDAQRLSDGTAVRFEADTVILAAVGIHSPLLVGPFGVRGRLPALGRYLTTHALGNVVGVFPFEVSGDRDFGKWLTIADDYWDEEGNVRGIIQQDEFSGFARRLDPLPSWMRAPFDRYYYHACQLLTIAEDEPRADNVVEQTDRGQVRVRKRFSARDRRLRRALTRRAREILRAAGAFTTIAVEGRSLYHACGTCRMGTDPATSVTDPDGRVWGTANLYVSDGSVLPTAGGVNPSLTIAANALRVADGVV